MLSFAGLAHLATIIKSITYNNWVLRSKDKLVTIPFNSTYIETLLLHK
jgi:hypothetical protein